MPLKNQQYMWFATAALADAPEAPAVRRVVAASSKVDAGILVPRRAIQILRRGVDEDDSRP